MPYTDKDGKRDYKREYRLYHGMRKQKDNRNMRNKARRKLGLKKGDGMEADHKVMMSKGGGNGKENLRAVTRTANRKRKWGRKKK